LEEENYLFFLRREVFFAFLALLLFLAAIDFEKVFFRIMKCFE